MCYTREYDIAIGFFARCGLNTKSVGKTLGFCALGAFLGFLQPMGLAMTMAVAAGAVLAALLYAAAGAWPVFSMAATAFFTYTALFGSGAALCAMVVTMGAAGVAIYMLRARSPFFAQMRATAFAQMLLFLLALTAGRGLMGTDLVDALVDGLRSWANGLSPMMADLMLSQFALSGMVDAGVYEAIAAGEFTDAARSEALVYLFDRMSVLLKLTLPGMLLSSSVLTGVLATSMPRLICARRGDEPTMPYRPVSEWFLPGRATGGLLLCLAVSFILNAAGMNGGDSIFSAVLTLCYTAAAIQGVAALSRRLKANGVKRSTRVILILAGVLLLLFFVRIYGMASALFGRNGLISGYVRRKHEEHDGGDDDE